MSLHQPVPSGGTPGNNVSLDTDGCSLTDVITTISPGGGASPTVPTIGGSGPGTQAALGWAKFGTDTNGNVLYIPVWK
jgi:hypothetical protein